ncbi:MAG: Rne/Rng family ribonuclease [Pseudomonadota bacterium]
MKRMLINATQEEELRMAMVDGQRLYDLNIEGPASERKKANIYKGKITRIEPSLEAAFVDYGAERHGFLPLKEISSEYFVREPKGGGKPNIRDVLKEGQDIVIQIDKEERGNKGAALTTFVSLAGRFIVLKPNKSRSGGVSRRIVGGDRDLARKSLNDIEVPDGMSVILRTAGIDRSADELAWDLENLLRVWQAILNVVLERPSPFLIYRESNAIVRALRDYLTNEIGEILIDDEQTFKEAREFVEQVMPHNLKKLKHYTDPVPCFTRFQIESQIESAFTHDVNLPSGGSIVIDHTEALVAIDINSARATKGGDIEATALNTNLEAADEIARQLRLRDLGGLVVIDFIDMGPQKNQRAVENRLREAVRQDRARVQIGKISRFGLLEMSRQRLRPSLGESSYHTCPRCSGIGTIRSVESLALTILRILGEEARKERTAKVVAQLPTEVATFLLNEKRDWVHNLETSHDTQVVLVANSSLETPHYDVRRVRDDQIELPENTGASYELTEVEAEPEVPPSMEEKKPAEKAAIGKVEPVSPAPPRKEPPKEPQVGLFVKLWRALFGTGDSKTKKPAKRSRKAQSRRGQDSRRGGQRKRNDRRGGAEKRAAGGESKSEGGQRSRRSRNRRKSSGEKPAAEKQTRQRAPKDEQKKQTKQPQKQDTEAKKANGAADQAAPSNDEAAPKKRRRSRGGRRRRRDGERTQQAEQVVAEQPDTEQAADTADTTVAAETRPPKARTDEERARDKALEDTSREKVLATEESDDAVKDEAPKKAKVKEVPPNPGNRLLPWDTPNQAGVVAAAAQAEEDETAVESDVQPDAVEQAAPESADTDSIDGASETVEALGEAPLIVDEAASEDAEPVAVLVEATDEEAVVEAAADEAATTEPVGEEPAVNDIAVEDAVEEAAVADESIVSTADTDHANDAIEADSEQAVDEAADDSVDASDILSDVVQAEEIVVGSVDAEPLESAQGNGHEDESDEVIASADSDDSQVKPDPRRSTDHPASAE